MNSIDVDARTRVLVLTGAGVSAESGIPTFRGPGGLWENHPVEEVASPAGFASDPELVWRFYSHRRERAKTCQPNPAHHALCALEQKLGDRFLLVTQNVDGLHRKAGSQRLIELHGNLFRTRCSGCDAEPFEDDKSYAPPLPRCERCASNGSGPLLRPHIVWFGEMLDSGHLRHIEEFLLEGARGRVVFVAAGTSGAVYPAAGLVDLARQVGAETWLVNADRADNASRFHRFIQGMSGEVLPRLFEVLD